MRTVLMSLLFWGVFSSMNACESDSFHSCDKTYVHQDQVVMNNEAISVRFLGEMLLTSSLHVDEHGLYFKDFKREGGCGSGKWECKICHACNPNYNLYCGECWN